MDKRMILATAFMLCAIVGTVTLVCFVPVNSADVSDTPEGNPLCFTAQDCTVKIDYEIPFGELSDINIQIWRINEGWIPWDDAEPSDLTLQSGESLYIKNINEKCELSNDSSYFQFRMNKTTNDNGGEVFLSGNVNSMINFSNNLTPYCYKSLFSSCGYLDKIPIDASNLVLPSTVLENYCYMYMFYQTHLEKAPIIKATRLADNCCDEMFSGCEDLEKAPSITPTKLASSCYNSMFAGCSSLIDISGMSFSVTELAPYCYSSMFTSCTSLVHAPILPAMELTEYCYNMMFMNCTSLITMPVLPATDIAECCYCQMFDGCTKLVSVQESSILADNNLSLLAYGNKTLDVPILELPATDLKFSCYKGMFNGCENLSVVVVLPAEKLIVKEDWWGNVVGCYQEMFKGCIRLEKILCYATDIPSGSTTDWLCNGNVREFYTPNPDLWPSGPSGIPKDCTMHVSYKIKLIPGEGATVELAYMVTDDRGMLIDELPVPECEGMVFDGWYTEDDILVTQSHVFKDSTDIYAKWSDHPTPEPTPEPEQEEPINQNILFIAAIIAVVLALFALAFVVIKAKK